MSTETTNDSDLAQIVKDLARETLERYREINLLYRASETIGASLDADEVPRLLMDEAARVIQSDTRLFLVGDAALPPEWASETSLIESVLASGRPDYTDSALCVPVRAGEKVLGVVVLGRSSSGKSFTASDEKLLLGLAAHAGVALERVRQHEQEKRRLQLEQELEVARRIQLTLLPSATPKVAGWDFAASYSAARQVGGDFYDFMEHALHEGRLGVAIADVTGKGMPAALMMAYSRAVLRAESMSGSKPADVLANTNRLFIAERQSRPFVSALYAEIDLESGVLTFASAGHDAPLLITAGGADANEVSAPGVILGAFSEAVFESRSVTLSPGDTFILYTDGITEARDHRRELFGDERFMAAAREAVATGGGAKSVLESITSVVASFTAGAEQADDLTIVVVQREGARHD